jgi:hypothetical protein
MKRRHKSRDSIRVPKTLISIPKTPISSIPPIKTRPFSRDNSHAKVSIITRTNFTLSSAIGSEIET